MRLSLEASHLRGSQQGLARGPLHVGSARDPPILQGSRVGVWRAARAGLHVAALGLHGTGAPGLALALAEPICFTQQCQADKDLLFSLVLTVPVVLLSGLLAYLVAAQESKRKEGLQTGQIFEDRATGSVFEVLPEAGAVPERDRRGELAFKAVSYTPWPVAEDEEGERLRIGVGPVGARALRTFVFPKVLRQPSELVVAKLERPLGIVLEEDAKNGRVFVAALLPGGNADQKFQNARLNPSLAASAPQEGDVLRACTTTTVQFGSGAVVGDLSGSSRVVNVYGADGQRWPAVMAALKRGLVSDGEVTMVFERPAAERPRPGSSSSSSSSSSSDSGGSMGSGDDLP